MKPLYLLALIGCLIFPVSGWAADILRIGTIDLPPTKGNPFRNAGAPHILTWSATFDGLTRIDQQGDLTPWLAVTWEATDDLTWVFGLRGDVRFSNGAPLTADAFVVAADFLTSGSAVREAIAQELDFILSAKALDSHTLQITTHEPTPHLPRAMSVLYALEPGQWTALGLEGFSESPIGTGPYHPVAFGETVFEYEAVPTSWRAPIVPRLQIIAAAESASRVQALLADQLDIAMILGPDENQAVEAAGGIGLHWPIAAVQALSFRVGRDTPLDDVRVREALNIAVNRKAIIDALLGGVPREATQPAVPEAFGYNESLGLIDYDPDRARALLAEAGYPDGFTFILEAIVNFSPNDAAVYQAIAQNLAAIGVIMEIRTIPLAQMVRGVMEGDWRGDAFAIAFALAPTIDALRPMRNHSCLWVHPWYCDQRIMPSIREAQVSMDRQRGLDLRQEIMRFYREEWVALYLYQYNAFAATRADVRGFSELHGFVAYEDIHFVKD